MTQTTVNVRSQASGMTPAQMQVAIDQLLQENAKLKANKASAGTSIKVSEKGAVSVYGLGRFPVTLYASQWTKLFTKQQDIVAFIEANKSTLAVKE